MESRRIELLEWDYPLFQVSFLENVVALCLDCLSNGYSPFVCFTNSEGTNLWDQFCRQPCSNSASERWIERKANFNIPAFPSKDEIKLYNSVFRQLVLFNQDVLMYFDNEYRQLCTKERKVLGVLCRGTDYTANKPKWHPVQPEVEEVIRLVKEKMEEYGFTHVYLATEEESISRRFEEAFPGVILTNKRQYFDSFYDIKKEKKEMARISQVHFDRDKDSYYKSLEYLSSLNILSKCSGLIAGSTGGSRLALIMNNNKYEYSYLFNKGFY